MAQRKLYLILRTVKYLFDNKYINKRIKVLNKSTLLYKKRRRGDSNPRQSCPCTNVPGLHLKPLGHLSSCLGKILLYL